MNSVLTCDDVFDVLTREPFPTGTQEDEFVESHLAVCHECRQLAEAFRPAVDLFHESLSEESEGGLPAYRGVLLLDSRRTSRTSNNKLLANRSFSAAYLVAITAAVLFVSYIFTTAPTSNEHSRGSVTMANSSSVLNNRGDLFLMSLQIPAKCHPDFLSVASSEFVCCTRCHRAEGRIASDEKTIVKTSVACAACHQAERHALAG